MIMMTNQRLTLTPRQEANKLFSLASKEGFSQNTGGRT